MSTFEHQNKTDQNDKKEYKSTQMKVFGWKKSFFMPAWERILECALQRRYRNGELVGFWGFYGSQVQFFMEKSSNHGLIF